MGKIGPSLVLKDTTHLLKYNFAHTITQAPRIDR